MIFYLFHLPDKSQHSKISKITHQPKLRSERRKSGTVTRCTSFVFSFVRHSLPRFRQLPLHTQPKLFTRNNARPDSQRKRDARSMPQYLQKLSRRQRRRRHPQSHAWKQRRRQPEARPAAPAMKTGTATRSTSAGSSIFAAFPLLRHLYRPRRLPLPGGPTVRVAAKPTAGGRGKKATTRAKTEAPTRDFSLHATRMSAAE